MFTFADVYVGDVSISNYVKCTHAMAKRKRNIYVSDIFTSVTLRHVTVLAATVS